MLRKVVVKSFKSLFDIEVELGRINVFVGANGSGKSSFLEALGVVGAAAWGRVDDESLRSRGVRPGLPRLYKSSFKGQRMRPSIGFQVSSQGARYNLELENPIDDPSPAWKYKSEKLYEGDDAVVGRSPASKTPPLDPFRSLVALKAVEMAANSKAKDLIEQLAAYAIYDANTDTLRGVTSDPQQRDPIGLSGGGLAHATLGLIGSTNLQKSDNKLLTDIFELIDWASPSLGFADNQAQALLLSPSVAKARHVLRFKDRFMADGRNQLTAFDVSEGALYVLFAFVLAAHPKTPRVLAIDNFDHGQNPRLARGLTRKMCEWVLASEDDKQLLLTSHNPLVLDGLPLQDDEVRLFAVDRSRLGRTVISRVRIADSELERNGEQWTVSRLWVNGHLGGVPDV